MNHSLLLPWNDGLSVTFTYWKFTSSKRILLLTFILTSAMDSSFVVHDKITKHVPAYVTCHTRLLFCRWWPRLLLPHPTAHEPFDNHGGYRVRRLWYLLHGIRATCLRIIGRGWVNKLILLFLEKMFKISFNEDGRSSDIGSNTRSTILLRRIPRKR